MCMPPLFNAAVKYIHASLLLLIAVQAWLILFKTEPPTLAPVLPVTYALQESYQKLEEVGFVGHQEPNIPPVICNVNVVDLNQDGVNEVLICDGQQHAVIIGRHKAGIWHESIIADDISAPAKTFVCDFDNDGDLDIIVADLGDIFPNNKHIGNVWLLENANHGYKKHLLLTQLRRVADARAHDFNGDGFLDIIVSEFGHDFGSVLLFQQQHDSTFEKTTLLEGPGSIHCPILDVDNDGDMDIATLLSQNEEEVWILINNGEAIFSPQQIYYSLNDDFGCSSLFTSDLDNNGFVDLVLTHGDNLEEFYHYPQEHHGCLVFYNINGVFKKDRVSAMPGCYSASIGDMNGDGLKDIVLASMVNNWNKTEATSISILIQGENNQFRGKNVNTESIKFISTAIGDLNNDGIADLIAGGFSIQPPFERTKRIGIWLGEQ